MKNLVTTILLIFLPFSLSLAQQEKSNDNPLATNSKALQFQISDNFNLASFSGSVISYKWQLSENRAKRIGVSLNNQFVTQDFPDADRDENTLFFNTSVEYTWLNYTDPTSDIKFYYGYGPVVSFRFNRNETDDENTNSTSRDVWYGAGATGFAGGEWFFHSSMSLHAEYRAGVQVLHQRFSRDIEDSLGDEDINEYSTIISFGGNGVRFGLSIYF